jgi:methionyl-tRNA synthetase
MAKKVFISTAIPYVNSSPHLGFALEIIEADVLARYYRSQGREVFFLTGTDENSLKNVKAAKEKGISVKELVDQNAKKFFSLKEVLNLSFDDFIRTTESRHILGAQKLWRLCQKDIYKKKYRGLYCLGCEEFYKKEELKNGVCPEHQVPPEVIEEENYFFSLSKYQKKLEKIIKDEKIKIIPESRKNEILRFIERGLEDICISRDAKRAQGWGIDVPKDKSQKIWVWFDALSNYINALGFAKNSKRFQEFWKKGEKIHIVGKGILRFHAVYWPAILLSAKLPLPNKILVHGYVTFEGQKISKSLGNVIEPHEVVKKYGTDPVRYFLLRETSPFEDLDFSFKNFEKRYRDDLAFGLGNLVSRVVGLALKLKKKISKKEIGDRILKDKIKNTQKTLKILIENFELNKALFSIWELISFCDKFIEEKKLWEETSKKESQISDLVLATKEIAKLLWPFLPETSKKILNQINEKKKKPIFPKI